jgi:hypothetical protein
MRPSPPRLVSAVLFFACAAIAAAGEAPKTFGGQDLQVVTVPHWSFQPFNDGTSYFNVLGFGDNYRHPTAGVALLVAPIDAGMVRNGAVIERVDFFVRDATASADADMQFDLCRSWMHLDGSSPSGDCLSTQTTSGSPGDTVVTLQPNLTVRYSGDVDTDGTDDAAYYVLSARFGVNGNFDYTTNLRLRGARILYRRQISPAAGTATFNDMPTSHPFFQFVEALAASGITAGCGSGNYCPDAPLTRGQMAVFLSKALGLYWPGE